jgi:hypothetical protein
VRGWPTEEVEAETNAGPVDRRAELRGRSPRRTERGPGNRGDPHDELITLQPASTRFAPERSLVRSQILRRLLPLSFHRLIVKALDFKPIGHVRQFVLDYLIDEHRLSLQTQTSCI